MKVLKIGGSCLETSADMARMAKLVMGEPHPVILVLSALRGVTNSLETAAKLAVSGGSAEIKPVRKLHLDHARQLPSGIREHAKTRVKSLLDDLDSVLKGLSALGEVSPRGMDRVLSFGERLAVVLAEAALNGEGMEARSFVAGEAGLITTAEPGDARMLPASAALVRERLGARTLAGGASSGSPAVRIVAGFLGRDQDGFITTLGRGGSDYTASFIGAALGCDVVLFKRNGGIRTADTQLVKETRVLSKLHYLDAQELAHFGLDAVHQKAYGPARRAGVRLTVVPFQAEASGDVAEGTEVSGETGDQAAICCVRDCVLVTLDGDEDEGDRGRPLRTLTRLVGALDARRLHPLVLSASTPRGEVSLLVRRNDMARVAEALEEIQLSNEADSATPRSPAAYSMREGVSVISVVGSLMRKRVGVAAAMFHCLAENRVNAVAIAQSACERSMSVVVDHGQAAATVQALHQRFVESDTITQLP